MGGILDKLDEWLRGLLIEGITGNLSGMFDTVNTKVGEIAGEVGQTPLAWNSGVFSMIRNLSETVIVPIAGVILTFVMCYELIQLVTEKNNLHDVDTWMFFKWIFKTFCAVLIVTNTWNIVMGIFDVGQSVVNSSAGVIIGNTSIDISSVITDMEAQLEALGTGELFGLWFQSLFVGLTMNALSICIMLVIYGRMIEVYLTTSVGPIPLATMTNRDWSHTGQNYLKSLFALSFQAFLIMVCVGIYSVLVQSIATDGNISGAIWACMGYTVLLCFALFKTGSLSKDLLSSPEIENIFENSDFVYLLNQASGDRKILCERLNISNQQAAHISNAGPGEGLIFFGNVILPFVDDFPKDNELYSIMTTKLGETGKGENEHE